MLQFVILNLHLLRKKSDHSLLKLCNDYQAKHCEHQTHLKTIPE